MALDYTYSGMKALTWDLSRGDTTSWTDRLFYLGIVQRFGQPVLDIGCGTGRILLDFLAQGIDIDGVDDSPEMLSICREKAAQARLCPTLYIQKMQALEVPRRYRTILIPSSSFQLLTDAESARTAMSRFYAHLCDGGALVTPFGFGWRDGDPMDTGWQLQFEKHRAEDGAVVTAWRRTWHEPEHQLWHEEQRLQVELNGRILNSEHLRCSPSGRWYSQEQAIQLLNNAGSSDIQLFSGFSHSAATADDRLVCAVALKE